MVAGAVPDPAAEESVAESADEDAESDDAGALLEAVSLDPPAELPVAELPVAELPVAELSAEPSAELSELPALLTLLAVVLLLLPQAVSRRTDAAKIPAAAPDRLTLNS